MCVFALLFVVLISGCVRESVTVTHASVVLGQLVTLNVAIHSSNNALLTLLMSNQFVELKGAVFKKMDKEHLFQTTCGGMRCAYVCAYFCVWVCARA